MPSLGGKDYTQVEYDKRVEAYGQKYNYQATILGQPNPQTKAAFAQQKIDEMVEAGYQEQVNISKTVESFRKAFADRQT